MSRNVVSFEPTNRFTNRVADYVRYRPRYPEAIVQTLHSELGLEPGHAIADIGSGTGFSAEMFLQNGNAVFGVEPNAAMRAAGERVLAGYPRFTSVAGSAEATTLPAASVDCIIAGQALHWFDLPAARTEFARIARPACRLAIFWNTHRAELSLFMQDYEDLLHSASSDYAQVNHERLADAERGALFADGAFTYRTFPYAQLLDRAALVGRTLSSSYAPPAGSQAAAALSGALGLLFDRYQQNGTIQYDYITELYFGRVARDA